MYLKAFHTCQNTFCHRNKKSPHCNMQYLQKNKQTKNTWHLCQIFTRTQPHPYWRAMINWWIKKKQKTKHCMCIITQQRKPQSTSGFFKVQTRCLTVIQWTLETILLGELTVARAPDLWPKRLRVRIQQEQRENFLHKRIFCADSY